MLNGSRRTRERSPFWAQYPDEDLLQLRFKDLNVGIEGTWLETCLSDLHRQLDNRNLRVRPHAWISEEWFSPDNTPGISLPFYLAHPRLSKLEKRMVRDVEGGTRRECMQILRHEAGHVVQHAYSLHRRRKWQQIFGRSSTPYPEHYRPDPKSRNYVQHLRRWYAQCHPDEDFAETFAVWLTPRSEWRRRYADWPALEKLEYVDELMSEIGGEKPGLNHRLEVDPIRKLTTTLDEHYKKKCETYAVDAPMILDHNLREIFSDDPRHRTAPAASAFIRRHRSDAIRLAARRTGEYELTLAAAVDDMIDRCRQLNLRAKGSETRLRSALTSLLASSTVHSLYSSRRRWFAV